MMFWQLYLIFCITGAIIIGIRHKDIRRFVVRVQRQVNKQKFLHNLKKRDPGYYLSKMIEKNQFVDEIPIQDDEIELILCENEPVEGISIPIMNVGFFSDEIKAFLNELNLPVNITNEILYFLKDLSEDEKIHFLKSIFNQE